MDREAGARSEKQAGAAVTSALACNRIIKGVLVLCKINFHEILNPRFSAQSSGEIFDNGPELRSCGPKNGNGPRYSPKPIP